MGEQDYSFKTPSQVENLYKNIDANTTGDLLEKKAFGGHVYLENVTGELARKLLDFEHMNQIIWEELAQQLTKKPHEKKQNKKAFREVFGCATGRLTENMQSIATSLLFKNINI